MVAATLLDLKAARLLPCGEVEDEEDLALLEARDLLFARLLQYRAYKQVAACWSRGWPRGAPPAARGGAGAASSPRCCRRCCSASGRTVRGAGGRALAPKEPVRLDGARPRTSR